VIGFATVYALLANLSPHLPHSQMPAARRFACGYEQVGQGYFFRACPSRIANLSLFRRPYRLPKRFPEATFLLRAMVQGNIKAFINIWSAKKTSLLRKDLKVINSLT